MNRAPLIPDAALRPPTGSSIAHPRPFGLRLVPSADGVSREVAHINNVEYVRWIDRAAELHADSLDTRANFSWRVAACGLLLATKWTTALKYFPVTSCMSLRGFDQ